MSNPNSDVELASIEPAETVLEAIARRHLGWETLTSRSSDRLDFHDVSVLAVASALRAAYEAGAVAATISATSRGRR
jgi:hypothetical protein